MSNRRRRSRRVHRLCPKCSHTYLDCQATACPMSAWNAVLSGKRTLAWYERLLEEAKEQVA